MKKIFLFCFIGFLLLSYCCVCKKQFQNKINDTNFINKGYLDYDLNSYNYDKNMMFILLM